MCLKRRRFFVFIYQVPRSPKTNGRKRLIRLSFCLPKKPCLRFLESTFVLFYKQIYSEMRNYCHRQWKIGYNFEMKRRIKIRRHSFVGELSDNNLTKFQPNWSRGCRLGSSNCMHISSKFWFRETRKNRISTVMGLASSNWSVNQ